MLTAAITFLIILLYICISFFLSFTHVDPLKLILSEGHQPIIHENQLTPAL